MRQVSCELSYIRIAVLDEDFFHGGDGRAEAVDAELGAVLLESVEELLEDGTALVRQEVVEFGADARLLAHVRHVRADHCRDRLLSSAAVLHQRQVIADPCTTVCRRKL